MKMNVYVGFTAAASAGCLVLMMAWDYDAK